MDDLSLRGKLESRLRELLERAGHLGADLSSPHSADSEEAAIEIETEDALIGERALVETEIAQVQSALDRIAQDRYGVCVTCEEEIAPARLAAMPEAAQCIRCASAGERA